MHLLAKILAWLLLPFVWFHRRFFVRLPAPKLVGVYFHLDHGEAVAADVLFDNGDVWRLKRVILDWAHLDGSGRVIDWESPMGETITHLRRLAERKVPHPLILATWKETET